MSALVAILYGKTASLPRWQKFHLHGRHMPAHLMPGLLPYFRRWVDYVRPITCQGNLVGLWVSSRMSRRRWQRLRALAEPFLVSSSVSPPPSRPVEEDKPGPRMLSLVQCGLHIPSELVNHTQEVLAQLGDIDITCDDDVNGEALLIPPGTSLKGLFGTLEIAVQPIEDGSPAGRKQRLERLRNAIRALDPAAA